MAASERPLTNKQQLFVKNYLITLDQKAAAKAALGPAPPGPSDFKRWLAAGKTDDVVGVADVDVGTRPVPCLHPNGITVPDVNQYLAVAALIAAGIHGIENELELEEITEGNAYASDKPRVPSTLREAAELFSQSAIAREAFGNDVVDHYLNNARVELKAFDSAITDWERIRGFERL